MIVLDTHVLVWADTDDRQLGPKARARIQQRWSSARVAVSAITFWEIGLLQSRGRLRLPAPLAQWRDSLVAAGLVEIPLDGSIAVRALDLSGLHEDPADRFIAATAIVHGAELMTADQRLLEWSHALARQDARQ